MPKNAHWFSQITDAPWKRVLLMVLAWVVIINVFALVAWNRIAVTRDYAYRWIDAAHLHAPSWSVLDLPERWDSEWYLDIAKHGYIYKGVNTLSNIVFFPLYPFLIRVVAWVMGGKFVLAGWLISLSALAAACVVLRRLVRDFHPKLDADEVVWLLLCFPTAIFFNAIYTESLFLFLSVSAMYFARKQSFLAASCLAAMASLTRVTGVLLFIPLVWEFFQKYGMKGLRRKDLLPLALIPIAFASFFAYHAVRFGSPWLFFQVESTWGRSFEFQSSHFDLFSRSATANFALDAAFFAFGLFMVVYLFKRVRASYAAYALATILVAVSTGTLMSIGRYMLVLFPIAIGIAGWPKPAKRLWFTVSMLGLALYTLLFAHSYWTG